MPTIDHTMKTAIDRHRHDVEAVAVAAVLDRGAVIERKRDRRPGLRILDAKKRVASFSAPSEDR